MGLPTLLRWRPICRRRIHRRAGCWCRVVGFVVLACGVGLGQMLPLAMPLPDEVSLGPIHRKGRDEWGTRFLAGRGGSAGMELARRRLAAMLAGPRVTPLGTAWQPVGPMQVASLAYGKVTGRVTSIAIDPADATGIQFMWGRRAAGFGSRRTRRGRLRR